MKTHRSLRALRGWIRVAALLVLLSGGAVAHGTTRWSTLEAIHQLENPRNLTRPGPCGELGAYQFRETTWRLHTQLPFQLALERPVSDVVAGLHYDYIRRGLERAGRAADAYHVALAWNAGLDAAVRGRAPRVAHRYAERAANLAVALAEERSRRFPVLRLPAAAGD